jgi:putative Holliday junction resolvase
MIWLAVDPGKRRLGVALSDELGWAHPLVTLERRGNRRDIEAIGRLAKEHGVEGIVVGLPLNLDGSEGEAARGARRLAAEIEKALALPVRLQDERLSSFEAEGRLKSAGVKIGRKRGLVDQLAAVVILEDFLAGWEKK